MFFARRARSLGVGRFSSFSARRVFNGGGPSALRAPSMSSDCYRAFRFGPFAGEIRKVCWILVSEGLL